LVWTQLVKTTFLGKGLKFDGLQVLHSLELSIFYIVNPHKIIFFFIFLQGFILYIFQISDESFRNRGATMTFARGGGNTLFCKGQGGGSPPFRKFFKNKSAFLRV